MGNIYCSFITNPDASKTKKTLKSSNPYVLEEKM